MLDDEIAQFFSEYRDAFNRLDGVAVARLYATPSGIASDRGYKHWPSYEPIRDNMIALCDLYRQNGYRQADFKVARLLPQGGRFAVADIEWHIERDRDQASWNFHTTYNLMRTGEGWRIFLCTAYEEKPLK